MQPPHFTDARTGSRFGAHEIDSFIELELKFNSTCRPSLPHEAGDIIMENGPLAGKSLDPLGLAETVIIPWTKYFDKCFKGFKQSIDRHFKKIHAPDDGLPSLDIVVIDFKYMDKVSPTLKKQVLDYIESPTFQHSQYVNDKYLIKLNF